MALLLAGALVAGVLATVPLPADAATCATIAPGEWLGTWVVGNAPASGGVVKFDLSFGATTVGGVMEFATGQNVFAGDDTVSGTRAPDSCDFTADIGGLVTLQGEVASNGVEMSGGWTYHPQPPTVAGSGTWQTGRVADSAAGSGLSLTTDPDSSGVSAGDPIATGVSSPNPGAITIDEAIATGGSLRGFSLLDTMVRVTAPSASTAAPLELTFDLDSSATGGLPPSSVTVYRNGEPVPLCLGAVPPISLDPCVSVAAVLDPPLSGLRFTVLTSEASSWMFGTPDPADRTADHDREPSRCSHRSDLLRAA